MDAIAVILLGPGLVAGVFAALPGIFDANENLRAVFLISWAALSSLVTYLGLRALRSRANVPDPPKLPPVLETPHDVPHQRRLP